MALWRLPRPDFHRLVDTDFQDTPLTLWPARSPSRLATLYIESSDSFVASAAVSIATGWSEPVPGREFHPLKSSAFHGALLRQLSGVFASSANRVDSVHHNFRWKCREMPPSRMVLVLNRFRQFWGRQGRTIKFTLDHNTGLPRTIKQLA